MPFTYNRSLTVDYTLVPSTQTDFPMLVNFTNNDFRTVGNGGNVQHASAYDVCFYSDAGLSSALFWEMESYNPVTGEVVAWVKIPSLSSSVDTVIYIGYGDSSISSFQSTASSVWDSDYEGVWHLPNGTTLTSNDSTSNAVHITAVNTPTAATGKIGGAAQLTAASTQYFTAGSTINPSAVTYSCWVKATSFANAYNALMVRNSASAFTVAYLKSNGKLAWVAKSNSIRFYDGTGATTLSTGTWYYLVFVYDSTVGLIGYVDGSVDGTQAADGALDTSAQPLRIGSDSEVTPREFDGVIEEPRVSSIVRSANWITTEYRNQNSPSTFYALGSEVQAGSGAARRMLTVPFLGGSRARAF